MINPITQILMTKQAELNEQLILLEKSWRKGEISFQVYSERSKLLIRNFYIKNDASLSHAEDVNKDKEPTGLLGIVLRVIRKIFH
tara:strand:+ start:366 stop:620 length:255 start_codon:yes stop_codon:yes gene_type:complete